MKSYRFLYRGNLSYAIKHFLKLLDFGKLSEVPREERLSNKKAPERWMLLKGTILKPQEKTVLIQKTLRKKTLNWLNQVLHNDPKHKWEFNTKWKLGQLSKRSTKSIYLFISIFILSTSKKRISKFENSLSYKETTVTHTGKKKTTTGKPQARTKCELVRNTASLQ